MAWGKNVCSSQYHTGQRCRMPGSFLVSIEGHAHVAQVYRGNQLHILSIY